MRNLLITILFLLVAGAATSQVPYRANQWRFGFYAGLDFTTTVPTVVKDSLVAYEGCATISTEGGRLLFYTDGVTVWDSTHTMMPNGDSLFSHWSSTQAAIIIPAPGNSEKYYIVTADQGGYDMNDSANGINYSMVDMRLNNGRGDVTVKNVPLLSPATEKLTAVYHCNGKNVWVLAHGWNNKNFYAWLITNNGISAPIVSAIGSVHGGDPNNTIGYMKFSPNGKKLALAVYYLNVNELFDFDNATGIVSNVVSLPDSGGYGVSFSPDNSRLYVSSTRGVINNIIYQYNLNRGMGHPDSIRKSKTVVASNKNLYWGSALQLTPDGKIYVANFYDNTLSVITHPNRLGLECQFVERAIQLAPETWSSWGLPNFMESYFAELPLQLNLQVSQLDRRLPGEIISLPILLSPIKTIQQGEKISFEITYDSDLLRIIDTPTSDEGSINNYNLDEKNGKISFVVELTKTLDTSQAVVAHLPLEILLSSHIEGSIEIAADIINQGGCAAPTSISNTSFTLGEECITANELKKRSTTVISSVYPNPSRGRTKVEITSQGNTKVKLEIIDTFGREIENLIDGELSSGHHEMELNTGKYPNGIYFCRLVYNNTFTVTPFIVRR